jgi:hypothetical protein
MSKALLWLLAVFPLAVQAGESVCSDRKCSAASVHFKIVIPEYGHVRIDESGNVSGSLNSRQTPAYTKDKNGTVTISFP